MQSMILSESHDKLIRKLYDCSLQNKNTKIDNECENTLYLLFSSLINNKMYFCYKNGLPDALYYTGINYGSFQIGSHYDPVWYIPKYEEVNEFINENKLKDYMLILTTWSSDCSKDDSIVEICNSDGFCLKIFEEKVTNNTT